MHVVFVSACEKKARLRTRRVLDSYALRSGDGAWMTPITQQGLEEVRKLLRKTATRQTAVACFRNDGRNRMRLLWVVGNKHSFDRHGASPVATRQSVQREQLPAWAQNCALLAGAAGILHDIGKFGKTFQDKLISDRPVADPVRHEWISLFIVRHMMNGKDWAGAWQEQAQRHETTRWADMEPFDSQLSSARAALLYLIATHHKLPEIVANRITSAKHVRDKAHTPLPVAAPCAANLSQMTKVVQKVAELPAHSALYWRAAATLSRMALILADHAVSAKRILAPSASAYANTDRASGRLNQSLDWHLEQVGRQASLVLARLLLLQPPALSNAVVEHICLPVNATSKYYWQEKAYRALCASREESDCPHLVLNMAGTGSGKTRINVRAACAIGDRDGKGVRFATALNLRTLTLQTGDAYAEQLGIPKSEMSCVIGDKLIASLHVYQKSLQQSMPKTKKPGGQGSDEDDDRIVDDDENSPENAFEAHSEFEYTEAPEWLAHFLDTKPGLGSVIGAPVLVSTVDFLIAAGDPHRQGNHALAALRLMTSDLILDEIDGYDPKALLAVLRLVMMSAFFGRNVIASSATLSQVVAKLLWQAYDCGAAMRTALTGSPSGFKTAFIDDAIEPHVERFSEVMPFLGAYSAHVGRMLSTLAGKRYRVPILQRVNVLSESSWLAAIQNGVESLHDNHRQEIPGMGAYASFGLVRIANINTAVKVANYLADKLPHARIVCYHSQHFPIQRFHIEKRLDALLNRNNGDGHLWADAEIQEAVRANKEEGRNNIPFIVVATPVEEIGRDHDFDWAVIEPSSTQSIVQTAGRVNRHRMRQVDKANVALLQVNHRVANWSNTKKGPVFVQPGLEIGNSHPDNDISRLLDWEHGIEQVDARLRFECRHKFAQYDDEALRRHTDTNFAHITGMNGAGHHWMGQETYTKSPLRDNQDHRVEMTLLDASIPYRFNVKEEFSEQEASSRDLTKPIREAPNAWLMMSDNGLDELIKQAGITRDPAFTVSVRGPFTDNYNAPAIARHMSFGFYRR
jgi:CRISPR-associated endonuclease/helicase Cas3